MLTDKEKQEIKEEAKNIMERFGRALEKVEKETSEAEVERNQDRRKEDQEKETDSEFRKIMLDKVKTKKNISPAYRAENLTTLNFFKEWGINSIEKYFFSSSSNTSYAICAADIDEAQPE